ncbi:MAG: chloramphenicol acetyltransferase, partial [Selenomonadaceae bacterium]|nr:chloramphenicol acetyltransferase [Selenomonadaceae bacterium]
MPTEIEPQDSSRAAAYKLWLNAPNPMVTFFKTLDVTNLVKVHENSRLKFNMLITYCVGKAACDIKEFFTLPVGEKLIRYNDIAVNTIVKNKFGEVNSCDILFSKDLNEFNRDYLNYTSRVAESCQDRDLSADCMVIGTSAVIETELDGVVGMNSGIF